MHIHGNPINLNLAHLHSAGAAEKAAATQRAAGVRKKLLQARAPIEEEPDADVVSRIGHSSDGGSQDHRPPEYANPRARHSANNPEPDQHPVSFWA